MRCSEIIREAIRNIVSGTSRVALLATAFALIAGGAIVVDVRTLALAQKQVHEWRRAGGGIVTFTAQGSIDGHACHSLSRVDGVSAAGALRQSPHPLQVAQLGTRTIPLYEATPGLTAMLDVRPPSPGSSVQPGPGVLISEAAAEAIGRQAGGTTDVGGVAVGIAGIVTQPDDGRVTPFEYSAIALVPPAGTFDACWLNVWPPNGHLSHLVRSTLSVGQRPADIRIEYGPINPRIAANIDPRSLYADRPTRWAPVAIAVSAYLLAFIAVMLRRLEFASALHARIRRRHLMLQHAFEASVWAGLGCAFLVPAAVASARLGTPVDPTNVDRHTLILLAVGLVSVLLGTLSATLVAREEHLLDYFKKR